MATRERVEAQLIELAGKLSTIKGMKPPADSQLDGGDL
jgi:hypothetical protein